MCGCTSTPRRLSASPAVFFFFFNDTATTEIYTLSLHDALPISFPRALARPRGGRPGVERSVAHRASPGRGRGSAPQRDRKSTRLNSSHGYISYAVFCLKKKKNTLRPTEPGGRYRAAWPARSHGR